MPEAISREQLRIVQDAMRTNPEFRDEVYRRIQRDPSLAIKLRLAEPMPEPEIDPAVIAPFQLRPDEAEALRASRQMAKAESTSILQPTADLTQPIQVRPESRVSILGEAAGRVLRGETVSPPEEMGRGEAIARSFTESALGIAPVNPQYVGTQMGPHPLPSEHYPYSTTVGHLAGFGVAILPVSSATSAGIKAIGLGARAATAARAAGPVAKAVRSGVTARAVKTSLDFGLLNLAQSGVREVAGVEQTAEEVATGALESAAQGGALGLTGGLAGKVPLKGLKKEAFELAAESGAFTALGEVFSAIHGTPRTAQDRVIDAAIPLLFRIPRGISATQRVIERRVKPKMGKGADPKLMKSDIAQIVTEAIQSEPEVQAEIQKVLVADPIALKAFERISSIGKTDELVISPEARAKLPAVEQAALREAKRYIARDYAAGKGNPAARRYAIQLADYHAGVRTDPPSEALAGRVPPQQKSRIDRRLGEFFGKIEELPAKQSMKQRQREAAQLTEEQKYLALRSKTPTEILERGKPAAPPTRQPSEAPKVSRKPIARTVGEIVPEAKPETKAGQITQRAQDRIKLATRIAIQSKGEGIETALQGLGFKNAESKEMVGFLERQGIVGAADPTGKRSVAPSATIVKALKEIGIEAPAQPAAKPTRAPGEYVDRRGWEKLKTDQTLTVGELITDPALRKNLKLDTDKSLANTQVKINPDLKKTVVHDKISFQRRAQYLSYGAETPEAHAARLKAGRPIGQIELSEGASPEQLLHEIVHAKRDLLGRPMHEELPYRERPEEQSARRIAKLAEKQSAQAIPVPAEPTAEIPAPHPEVAPQGTGTSERGIPKDLPIEERRRLALEGNEEDVIRITDDMIPTDRPIAKTGNVVISLDKSISPRLTSLYGTIYVSGEPSGAPIGDTGLFNGSSYPLDQIRKAGIKVPPPVKGKPPEGEAGVPVPTGEPPKKPSGATGKNFLEKLSVDWEEFSEVSGAVNVERNVEVPKGKCCIVSVEGGDKFIFPEAAANSISDILLLGDGRAVLAREEITEPLRAFIREVSGERAERIDFADNPPSGIGDRYDLPTQVVGKQSFYVYRGEANPKAPAVGAATAKAKEPETFLTPGLAQEAAKIRGSETGKEFEIKGGEGKFRVEEKQEKIETAHSSQRDIFGNPEAGAVRIPTAEEVRGAANQITKKLNPPVEFAKEVRDKLSSSFAILSRHESGRRIIQAVVNKETDERMWAGQDRKIVKDEYKGVSSKTKSWMNGTTVDYFDSRIHHNNFKRLVEHFDNAEIRNSAPKDAVALAEAFRKMDDGQADRFTELGGKVYETPLDEQRLSVGQTRLSKFKRVKNHFPHFLTSETRKALQSQRGDLYRALEDWATGEGLSEQFSRMVSNKDFIVRHYGSLEYHRYLNLPDNLIVNGERVKVLEADFGKVVNRIVVDGNRRIAMLKYFGQDNEKLRKQYADIARDDPNAARDFKEYIIPVIQGVVPGKYNPDSRLSTAWNAASDVARTGQLSMSMLAQPGGFVFVPTKFGVRASAIATFGRLRHLKSYPELEELRVLSDAHRDFFEQYATTEGMLAKTKDVDRIVLSPMIWENRQINDFAMLAAKHCVIRGLRAIKEGDAGLLRRLSGTDPKSYIRQLKNDFEFTNDDIVRMVKDGLSERDLARIAQRAPALANAMGESALDRPAWLFLRPAQQILAYTSFTRALGKMGMWGLKEAKRGNLKPLAYFLFGGLASAEIVAALKNVAYDRQREDKNYLDRVWTDVVRGGMLGLAGNVFETMQYALNFKDGIREFLVPPQLDFLINISYGTYEYLRDRNPRIYYEKTLRRTIPLAKFVGSVGLRIGRGDSMDAAQRLIDQRMVYFNHGINENGESYRRFDPKPQYEHTALMLLRRTDHATMTHLMNQRRKEKLREARLKNRKRLQNP